MNKTKFLSFLGLCKRARKTIVGYNKCEEEIKKTGISLLILSKDASENTRDKFSYLAKERNIRIIQDFTEEELGHSIGEIEIKVIGIKDKSMSNKLIEHYDNENSNLGGE